MYALGLTLRLLLVIAGFAAIFAGCYYADNLPDVAFVTRQRSLAAAVAGWLALTAGLIGLVAPGSQSRNRN